MDELMRAWVQVGLGAILLAVVICRLDHMSKATVPALSLAYCGLGAFAFWLAFGPWAFRQPYIESWPALAGAGGAVVLLWARRVEWMSPGTTPTHFRKKPR
jgi:hypothetical protein